MQPATQTDWRDSLRNMSERKVCLACNSIQPCANDVCQDCFECGDFDHSKETIIDRVFDQAKAECGGESFVPEMVRIVTERAKEKFAASVEQISKDWLDSLLKT